jgi:hypothetical protein
LDYAPTGPDLQFMTTVDGDSWPVPELDSVGFEELPSYSLLIPRSQRALTGS